MHLFSSPALPEVLENDGRHCTVKLASGLVLIVHHVYQYRYHTQQNAVRDEHPSLSFHAPAQVPYCERNSTVLGLKWIIHRSLGVLKISPEARDRPFVEQVQDSLEMAFGGAAVERMDLVIHLARLRQTLLGWTDVKLDISPTHPRGRLVAADKKTSIVLKANGKRSPPDLDAFLGEARWAGSEEFGGFAQFYYRPSTLPSELSTGHARLRQIRDVVEGFARHGVDLSPWEKDLIG